MRPHRHLHRSFTLIELLVVVAIIAILASLLLPGLSRARDQARLVACMNQQRQIVAGVTLYTTEADGWYPPTISRADPPPGNPGGYWNSWPFFLNYRMSWSGRFDYCHGGQVYRFLGEYLPQVAIFVCPLSRGRVNDMQPEYATLAPPGDVSRNNLTGSYLLWWGTRNTDQGLVAGYTPVKMPRRVGESDRVTLLVSDTWMHWGNYISSHPFPGGTPRNDHEFYGQVYQLAVPWGAIDSLRPDVSPAAGYDDGSVGKWHVEDATIVRAGGNSPSNPATWYLPLR